MVWSRNGVSNRSWDSMLKQKISCWTILCVTGRLGNESWSRARFVHILLDGNRGVRTDRSMKIVL